MRAKVTRRVFLRNAATVGVAAAFPSIVPARVLGKELFFGFVRSQK